MRHTNYFRTVLNDTVNLPQAKLSELEGRVKTVYNALVADATIGGMIVGKIPQGSWPHQTIIKPKVGGEFDADFLLEFEEQPGWTPSRYINEVYYALDRHSTYTKMPHGRKCHCVYLDYAEQNDIGCHLDIVPYLQLSDGRTVIANRDDDVWEETDPLGFTEWMKERDNITHGHFRRAVRLLKYMKVERGSFNGVRSVVLTVVAGSQVASWRELIDTSYYTDLPTTFLHIMEDLDSWLQSNPIQPSVPNPGSTGTFDHRWDQTTYSNFRTRIHVLAPLVRAAYDADADHSQAAWQKIFGESFAPDGPAQPKRSTSPFKPAAATTIGSLSGRSG